MAFPGNLDALEKHIDGSLSNLRIYRLPIELALVVSLTVFEDTFRKTYERVPDRFSAEAAMMYHKAALQILIPQIFRRCSKLSIGNKVIEVTFNALADVSDALEFCQRYDIATLAYTQLHHGWFSGSLNGRVADFAFAEGIDFGRAQLNFSLHGYQEWTTLTQSLDSGKLPPSSSTKKCKEAILKEIQHTSIEKLLWSVPDDAYIPFREIAEATIPKATVDTGARCGNYTVDEYHQLWLELATLMAVYVFACKEKGKIDKSFNVLAHRILQISLEGLASLVANRGNIEYKPALSILTDMVLDLAASRPDVLIQPLVPVPDRKIILLSPSLILTSNWEVCLLRNWISRYPDAYGHVVASKKEKLADQLGKIFDSTRFKVSARKKLRSQQGQEMGDVDVAVFDPIDGLLVLLEVKWLIEPDSPRETIRSHQEITKGAEQLLKLKAEFTRDASNFLKQVFPEHNIETTAIKDLLCFVIGHGDVGIKDAEQNNIFVLGYSLVCNFTASARGSSLRQIITDIINEQRKLSESVAKRAGTMKVKLAGFLFSLPGYGTYIQGTPSNMKRKERTRNDRCLCGSGLKYKKCCLELACYPENVT